MNSRTIYVVIFSIMAISVARDLRDLSRGADSGVYAYLACSLIAMIAIIIAWRGRPRWNFVCAGSIAAAQVLSAAEYIADGQYLGQSGALAWVYIVAPLVGCVFPIWAYRLDLEIRGEGG